MFFLMFFLFNPPGAGKFKLQKDCFILDVTWAEEIQKSASTELHEWSKNMVNVENYNFLKVNCWFLLVISVKWKQSLCSITLLCSSTFYGLFLPFFVLEIFKFNYDMFFVTNSAAISKFNWFEQLCGVGQNGPLLTHFTCVSGLEGTSCKYL